MKNPVVIISFDESAKTGCLHWNLNHSLSLSCNVLFQIKSRAQKKCFSSMSKSCDAHQVLFITGPKQRAGPSASWFLLACFALTQLGCKASKLRQRKGTMPFVGGSCIQRTTPGAGRAKPHRSPSREDDWREYSLFSASVQCPRDVTAVR